MVTNGSWNQAAAEPTKVDMAASEACVRSGAFALLLSVALFLLVPSWREQPNYAALRLCLADSFLPTKSIAWAMTLIGRSTRPLTTERSWDDCRTA
jgi:hypothetical protein